MLAPSQGTIRNPALRKPKSRAQLHACPIGRPRGGGGRLMVRADEDGGSSGPQRFEARAGVSFQDLLAGLGLRAEGNTAKRPTGAEREQTREDALGLVPRESRGARLVRDSGVRRRTLEVFLGGQPMSKVHLRWGCYAARDRELRRLGFGSYRDYLASDLWKGIRQRILARHPRCFLCGDTAEQVHHGSYKRAALTGKDLRTLFSLCRACHESIEFRPSDGAKLNLGQAMSRMMRARFSRVRRRR
jgi:hypothetical protein